MSRSAVTRIAGQPVHQRFVRAIGPGGQNARHTATAVELRLDVSRAKMTSDEKSLLRAMPGARFTKDGVLVVVARGSRSQLKNRDAARSRLLDLVLQTLAPRARRAPAAVPPETDARRLAEKHRTAERKRSRHARGSE